MGLFVIDAEDPPAAAGHRDRHRGLRGDPDVSCAEMSRLQGIAVEAARKVPEVADIVSVAGTGTVNQTPNGPP